MGVSHKTTSHSAEAKKNHESAKVRKHERRSCVMFNPRAAKYLAGFRYLLFRAFALSCFRDPFCSAFDEPVISSGWSTRGRFIR